MTPNGPKPVLLLDVGYDCTGVAVAKLQESGRPEVTLSLIVPEATMPTSRKTEKRACIHHGDRAEQLYIELCEVMAPFDMVFAELPTMGAMNASGMRGMSLSLAAYRCACWTRNLRRIDFIRSDVVSAALGSKKVTDETKLQTRRLVTSEFYVVDKALPETKMVKHRRTGVMLPCEKTEQLRDNAFDAAAVLFAARNHEALRVQAGWGDWRMQSLTGVMGDAKVTP